MSGVAEEQVEEISAWVKENGFSRVALQFPDSELASAVKVAEALESSTGARAFILADTTFGSCCIDEVAAEHVKADSIVHYGRSCLSLASRTRTLLVFPRGSLDPADCAGKLIELAASCRDRGYAGVLVAVDQEASHAEAAVRAAVAAAAAEGNPAAALLRFAEPLPRDLFPSRGAGSAAAGAPAPAGGCCGAGGGCACSRGAPAGACGACGCSAAAAPMPASALLPPPAGPSSDPSEVAVGPLRWRLPPDAFAPEANTPASDEGGGSDGESQAGPAAEGAPLPRGSWAFAWVGEANAAHTQAVMVLGARAGAGGGRTELSFHRLCPRTLSWEDGSAAFAASSQFLRRRYYLVERAKDAGIVGIVAGTLGVAGYRDAINRVRQLAAAAGKKSYTFLVGKPNPAKLGNFPECEIFVLIACPETALLDSRDYITPVITAFEAELAFRPGAGWDPSTYRVGFPAEAAAAAAGLGDDLAALGAGAAGADDDGEEGDISLVTGKVRVRRSNAAPAAAAASAAAAAAPSASAAAPASLALVTPSAQELASRAEQAQLALRGAPGAIQEVSTAAEFLRFRRTYQGLDPTPRAEGEYPLEPQQGLVGRAATYASEAAGPGEAQDRSQEATKQQG